MVFERRRHPRLSTIVPAVLKYQGTSQPDGWGLIYDISMGGLEFETRMQVKKGQNIYISFKISDNFDFKNIPAKIVRVESWEKYNFVGLEFNDRIDRRHLADAMAHYLETDLGRGFGY